MQVLLDPVYVKIGPHFAGGQRLDAPPAPLFPATTDVPDEAGETGGSGTAGGRVKPAARARATGQDRWRRSGATAARSSHQVIYLLAPDSLTDGERREVVDSGLGRSAPAGRQRRQPASTRLPSPHTDAFEAVRYGAAGSIVYIVEPQRIGSGITHAWMAANFPDVDHGLLDLTKYRAGAARRHHPAGRRRTGGGGRGLRDHRAARGLGRAHGRSARRLRPCFPA